MSYERFGHPVGRFFQRQRRIGKAISEVGEGVRLSERCSPYGLEASHGVGHVQNFSKLLKKKNEKSITGC